MSLRYGNADNKPAGGGKSGLGLACVSVAVGADTDGMVKFGLGAWGRSGRKTGTGLLRGFLGQIGAYCCLKQPPFTRRPF